LGSLGISGSASATNSRNLGESSQTSTSEDISSSERIIENAAKELSLSERNDELTQVSKDHAKTLSEVEQHSRNRSYHEQQARNYQELLSQGESLSFSHRNNLLDSAMKITQEKHGVSQKEAFDLLNSQRPEDQATKNEILREAYDKSSSFRHGESFMKQPNFARFSGKNSSEKTFQPNAQNLMNNSEFDQQAQQIKTDVELGKQFVQTNASIVKQDIQKEEKSIQNKSQKIKQKVQERSKIEASKAAVNQLKDTWVGEK
jgi:hypothetical protein